MLDSYVVYLETAFRAVRAASAATGRLVKATSSRVESKVDRLSRATRLARYYYYFYYHYYYYYYYYFRPPAAQAAPPCGAPRPERRRGAARAPAVTVRADQPVRTAWHRADGAACARVLRGQP